MRSTFFMKILFLDIETSPNTAHVWGLWQNNVSINQLLESSYVMCWAAKWAGEKKVMFDSVYHSTEKDMLKRVHALLDECDIVCHYNGSRFDIPTLNKEFLINGLPPPSPYKQIDLLQTVRRKFRFPSNKLDYVAQRLGVGKKFQHEGHTLWIKCMNNDAAAWKIMKNYNSIDAALLEKVYEKMLPWISGHPNVALYNEKHTDHCCPHCGGKHTQKRGTYMTAATVWQRYRCKDCGTWSKGEKVRTVKGTLTAIQ